MKKPTMHTIIQAPRQLKLFGAILAIAALAVALLAVAFTADSTRAENSNMSDPVAGADNSPQPQNRATATPTATTPPVTNRVPAACHSDPEKAIDRGRIAIFDVFYDDDGLHADVRERTLVNNPCPAEFNYLTETEQGRNGPTTRITGTARGDVSRANVNTTVFHVGSTAVHTLSADDETKYDFLGDEGDTVWFLPTGLDDPANANTPRTSRKSPFPPVFCRHRNCPT